MNPRSQRGLTMIELMISAVLMAFVAYIASTLFTNIESSNRSANAKSEAHESFRILTMRFDNQIQNRMPAELATAAIDGLGSYAKVYSNPQPTRLKTHAAFWKQGLTNPSFDRFVMTVECAAITGWQSSYNGFIQANDPCSANLPKCSANQRPVIRFSQIQGLTADQVKSGDSSIQHIGKKEEEERK